MAGNVSEQPDPAALYQDDPEAATDEQQAARLALREAAQLIATSETADTVTMALNNYQGTLKQLAENGGPAPAAVSRIANGRTGRQGTTVSTLAQIALAMGKSLKISIE